MIEDALLRHFELWAPGHDDPSLKESWLALFAVASPDGREAATVVRIRMVTDDGEVEFRPIGFWTGTDDGRIQSSRIFGVSSQMGPDAWPPGE